MSCARPCDDLPAFVYDDLAAEERKRLETHLAKCADCRREVAALRHVQVQLDRVPVPEIHVDLVEVYRLSALHQQKKTRRWRRLALMTAATAAAVVFIVLGTRLQLRAESHQLILSWGSSLPGPEVLPKEPWHTELTTRLDGQLSLLSQIVQALAVDSEGRSQFQQDQISEIRGLLADLQQRSHERWKATEGDVNALYAAQFVLTKKGDTNP